MPRDFIFRLIQRNKYDFLVVFFAPSGRPTVQGSYLATI